MKRKQIDKVIFFLLATMIVFVSCETNNDLLPAKEELVKTEIVLSMEEMNPILTTGSSYASSESDGGIVISYNNDRIKTKADNALDLVERICILQFERAGKEKLIAKEYFDLSDIIIGTEPDGRRVFKITPLLGDEVNCRLYVIANESPSTLSGFEIGQSTFADYRAFKLTVSPEAEINSTNYNPMEGSFVGRLPTTSNIRIWLTRLIASVSCTIITENLPENIHLTLSSIQLQSVPTVFKYYDEARYSGTIYPPVSSTFVDYEVKTGVLPSISTHNWYMPENRRGQNKNITDQKQKWREEDPSWTGSISYSSRVVIKGDCSISGVDYYITITLYPGINAVDEFSIRANYLHNMIVDIRNIAADDKRIELVKK